MTPYRFIEVDSKQTMMKFIQWPRGKIMAVFEKKVGVWETMFLAWKCSKQARKPYEISGEGELGFIVRRETPIY